MPWTDLFLNGVKARGLEWSLDRFRTVWAPAGLVLRKMGGAGAWIADNLDKVDAEAKQVGTLLHRFPLAWERHIPVAKQEIASKIIAQRSSPDIFIGKGGILPALEQQYLRDPQIASLVSDMQELGQLTNRANLAARDALGNPLQTYNLVTQELRPYTGRAGDYFPLFVKSEKYRAITDPIEQVKTILQKRIAPDRQTILTAEETINNGIDDFLRTGQPNTVVTQDLAQILRPAYETMQELANHMRQLNQVMATRRGQAAPSLDVDYIPILFGSNNPDDTRKGFRLLRTALVNNARIARRFGNLEYSRTIPLPADWYELNPVKAWSRYLVGQARRLAEIKTFGNNNELVLPPADHPGIGTEMINQIANQSDREFARQLFEKAMGLGPVNRGFLSANVMDTIFGIQAITKLGTAQISQFAQLLNSIIETDLSSTVKAIARYPFSRKVAEESGSVLTQVLNLVRNDLMDEAQTGIRRATDAFLRYSGFEWADMMSRHIAAGAGYNFGEKMIWRLARNPNDSRAIRELTRFLPDTAGDLIQRVRATRIQNPTDISRIFHGDLLNIARRASEDANFRNSALDLPLWTQSPVGKLFSMFRTFGYKQAGFVSQAVKGAISDIRHHNDWHKAVSLASAMGIAAMPLYGLGELISLVRSIPRGSFAQWQAGRPEDWSDNEKLVQRAFENILSIGALGVFDQVNRAMVGGERAWTDFLLGPVFGDVVKFLGGIASTATQVVGMETPFLGRPSQLGEFAVRQVPIIGGGLARAVRESARNVERLPSGAVMSSSGSIIGVEPPESRAAILVGAQLSVPEARQRAMDELRSAIEENDVAKISRIVQKARQQGVIITAESINRMIRNARRKQALETHEV